MFDLTPFAHVNRYAAFDPFKEMERFEKAFFNSSMPALRTDIRETDTAYILEADLPGFEKDEIHVSIENDVLTINASHSSESNGEKEKSDYVRRERSFRSYNRSFDIGGIVADDISATYNNGVLELTLPKSSPKKSESRKIAIK